MSIVLDRITKRYDGSPVVDELIQAVTTLAASMKGAPVAARIDTGARVATSANMGEPEIARLLE